MNPDAQHRTDKAWTNRKWEERKQTKSCKNSAKFCEQKSWMYINKPKTNAEEKLDFLKQTKRTLQRKMKVEGPSFYMLCCFQFPEENFVHFTFHIFLPKMFSSALNTLSKFHIGTEKQFWQRYMKLDFQQKTMLIL